MGDANGQRGQGGPGTDRVACLRGLFYLLKVRKLEVGMKCALLFIRGFLKIIKQPLCFRDEGPRPDILRDMFKVTLVGKQQQAWDCWKLVIFSLQLPLSQIMNWQLLRGPEAKLLLIATI